MTVNDIVAQLKAYNPQKIILFGSRATDTSTSSSDYDIALIKETDKPFHDRVIEARRFLRTDSAVDLFVFTPRELEEKKVYEFPDIRNYLDRQGNIWITFM